MARRAPPSFEHRGIAEILERGIAEGGKKKMLDEFVAKLAAAAVAHHDGGIVGERQRAGPVGEIGRCRSFQRLSAMGRSGERGSCAGELFGRQEPAVVVIRGAGAFA